MPTTTERDEATAAAEDAPADHGTDPAEGSSPAGESGPDHEVVEDLLVEEVSIDGMCGVY